MIQDNKSATIKCENDQTLFVPCAWDGSQTSPTITTHNANGSQRMPDKEHFNCVIAVEGNGTRPSHKGSGYSEDNVSFTLNATEHHGVAYGFFPQMKAEGMAFKEEVAATVVNGTNPGFQNGVLLSANDAKVYDARGNGDGEIANTITGDHNDRITDYTTICKQGYIVRRLTPTECARLQGFPDWWCADLDTPDPTENDIAYWSEVFETYRKVVNPDGKPKTKKQIIKWLQHPHTDSAEYKMWGNGVALPCVYYVMQGIASIMSED